MKGRRDCFFYFDRELVRKKKKKTKGRKDKKEEEEEEGRVIQRRDSWIEYRGWRFHRRGSGERGDVGVVSF